ncbi:MAG: outer membrane protein transport protein [Gemmataceae bacterium]
MRLSTPLALLVCAASCSIANAQGTVLSGAGPVNRSMGSAATAAPIDATGALYWNPASITGLKSSQLELGLELLYPRGTIGSSIPANAAAPGAPPVGLFDKTRDESGVYPLPTGGFVYKPVDSPWSFGLGLFPAAGFGTNYASGNGSNPILSAPPPAGVGLGPVSSNYQVLQIAPTAAYKVTDRLSIGFAPLVNMARLSITPGVFAAPNDANGDGFFHYSTATSTRFAWGAGFQIGAYYVASDDWSFGASFKSPQWFEPFRYQLSDELGRGRNAELQFDLPLIVSVGTAYTGIEKLTLACDVRYLNFRNTAGFRNAGFDATGATTGLGWSDVFSVSLGSQYQLTEKLSVRLGYTYNTQPIPGDNTTFNVASPLTYQHQAACGASYQLTDACTLSAAYYHVFYTAVSGPYLTPSGAIPGAAVSTGADVDSVLVGIRVAF